MNRLYAAIGISAFLAINCSSTKSLSGSEKAKLDPPLIQLLTGKSVSENQLTYYLRKDGTKEYAVIVRSDKPEEIKNLGIPISSIFGDIIVVRVTEEELRKIIPLTSVRAVQVGSRNILHQQ